MTDNSVPDPDSLRNDEASLYSPGWVARRLGVTPTTLRTWHHRYDLGPTGRSAGGHRRYSPADLARLDRMLDLTTSGVAVAEAARLSHLANATPSSAGPQAAAAREHRPTRPAESVGFLGRAAVDLDQTAIGRVIADHLQAHGVVMTWTDLIVPVLQGAGERFARTADGIEAEHILSESIRAAFGDLVRQDRRWARVPPILIAAPDGEQHVLPLHALAAGLAELGRPSVLLGASVPTAALIAAAARIGPAAIFLWSQDPSSARTIDPARLDLPADKPAPTFVLGGPGWHHRPPGWAATWADDLPTALRACADATPAA